MPVSKSDLMTIKSQLESHREEMQRLQGKLDSLMQRLKEMGYETINEAVEDLEKKKHELDEDIARADVLYAQIKEKFPQLWK